MTKILQRGFEMELPKAVKGEGIFIYDDQGKQYLDGCSGAAVSCLGHNNQQVVDAIKKQLDGIPFAHTGYFTTEASESLADFLVERSPGLDYCYYVSGGSEAVEAAIKMARQYFIESGQPQRRYLVARKQSYHGNTLGALAAGGNQLRRDPFKPLLIETHHVSPCFYYRFSEEGETEEAYTQRLLKELEDTIETLGGENIMAFVAEPVVGATTGAVTATANYFKQIRALCNQHGILLILDEVMCGMGRTGSLHAYLQEGIEPDIITIAKGLGAGYQPIGAVMLSAKIYEAFASNKKAFQHGHTYMGHPCASAAALAVQKYIEDNELLARVQSVGNYMFKQLHERYKEHPYIGDIRGRGLFCGIEFVADKATRQPFAPSLALDKEIKLKAFQEGLMCYPMPGTIDGKYGFHVMFAPPYIIQPQEIDMMIDKFDRAVAALGLHQKAA